MLPAHQNAWYRALFRLKLYEVSGESFQAFFNKVMELRDCKFQSIRPWGNWGDGGNDGWIESEGHYFQLYGPGPATLWKPKAACDKAINDFKKLPSKWKNVRQYTFVLNDRFEGIPGPIASALQALKIKFGLTEACALGAAQIFQYCMALDEERRIDILGGIPPLETPDGVDLSAVGLLLSSLADRSNGGFEFLREDAPDFAEKIEFNGLTPPVSKFLESDSWQASLVEDFLQTRDPGLQQAIAQELHNLYILSKTAIPDSDPDASNLRYFWLVEQLVPNGLRRHPHTVAAYRQAARLVIAKYFETCDAYDNPNGTSAP